MEDPKLFTLPCRLGDSKPFDTLADLGSCVQIPYYARKDFLDCHLLGEWEIARDAEINPFKDVLVFRRMVEFLRAKPINLKSNMWESEDLINTLINWNKPPKNEDGAWHAKIRLIDPDGEEFTKTLQSIPTTRKLSERESPREIISLDTSMTLNMTMVVRLSRWCWWRRGDVVTGVMVSGEDGDGVEMMAAAGGAVKVDQWWWGNGEEMVNMLERQRGEEMMTMVV
nr:hypothetical protein [Tanacetum cinerariifolium]